MSPLLCVCSITRVVSCFIAMLCSQDSLIFQYGLRNCRFFYSMMHQKCSKKDQKVSKVLRFWSFKMVIKYHANTITGVIRLLCWSETPMQLSPTISSCPTTYMWLGTINMGQIISNVIKCCQRHHSWRYLQQSPSTQSSLIFEDSLTSTIDIQFTNTTW